MIVVYSNYNSFPILREIDFDEPSCHKFRNNPTNNIEFNYYTKLFQEIDEEYAKES